MPSTPVSLSPSIPPLAAAIAKTGPITSPVATDRLSTQLSRLTANLLERDTAARLALLAALAGEHVLLIGPPGTAKSELARRLHKAFDGAPYFERLLTRFSTPEELFGPLSLQALEQDRYERLTAGFLPTAGIAFLDEVFKANSAILNALLTLLNEREFDNGAGRVKTPLISVVAASNEVPADDALQAFYDRFLVRVAIHPVSDPVFVALLRLPADAAGRSATLGEPDATSLPVERAIDAADRAAIAAAADHVEISEEAIAACVQLRGWLAQRDLNLSDRRWRRWLGLMRTAAATEGRARIDAIDLWLAPYVASPRPDIAPLLANWFADDLMRAVPQQAPWLTRAVLAFEKQLQLEAAATDSDDAAARDAGKIAIARAIGSTGPIGLGTGAALDDLDDDAPAGDGGMVRMVSAQLEAHRRRRYSSVHVATRVTQVDSLIAHVDAERLPVAQIAADLAQRLAGSLWLPAELAQRLTAAHAATLAVLASLAERLQAARAGFEQLPVDDRLPGVAPPSPADTALSIDAAEQAASAPTPARGAGAAAFASSASAGASASTAAA
jgi:MoxR-like ATPase